MRERYARQSFLGASSEELLDRAVVAIVGLGGGGSHVAQQLAHVGVGTLLLFDPDIVDDSNLNRLVGATEQDVIERTPKVIVAERLIRGVNPRARVTAVRDTWQNQHLLLREADLIVGSVDSFSERFQLESVARRLLIPYLDLGIDVHEHPGGFAITGQVALSMPGYGCLQCMGIITPDQLGKEKYGAAGGRPQVVWPNGSLASAAVGIIIGLFTPWHEATVTPVLLRYDGNRLTLEHDHWLAINAGRPCPHFLTADVGDPFFVLSRGASYRSQKPSWWRSVRARIAAVAPDSRSRPRADPRASPRRCVAWRRAGSAAGSSE